MSIAELIEVLRVLAVQSPLGDHTQVYMIREEYPPIPIGEVKLIKDDDGAIVELLEGEEKTTTGRAVPTGSAQRPLSVLQEHTAKILKEVLDERRDAARAHFFAVRTLTDNQLSPDAIAVTRELANDAIRQANGVLAFLVENGLRGLPAPLTTPDWW